MKKVVVSGGAGYIGSVLVRLLIDEGYMVRVIDNMRFGGESVIGLLDNPRFELQVGDITNSSDLKKAVENADYAVHLAAIVGDPACAKEPDLARQINLEGSKRFYQAAEEAGLEKFVFASTCSNYGKMKDAGGYVNEESELAPVSLYAELKVEVERFLLSREKRSICIPTCLRFSTVYGLSPRVRFDLTVNEFTRELAMGRELKVFGEQFWRPYCHVNDLSRSVLSVLKSDSDKVAFQAFNVGDTDENYQKQMIVDEILKQIPEGQVSYVKKDEDPRDYRVNFDKIHDRLGFIVTKKVPDGIAEIKQVIEDGVVINPDDSKYRNI